MSGTTRKFAQGAEITPEGVDFRIYAPEHHRVDLVLLTRGQVLPMQPEQAGDTDSPGFWSLFVEGGRERERYCYRLDGEPTDLPDPAARYLPEGPHGAAEVVDPSSFVWSDLEWRGLAPSDQVIYELHVGSFSPEGNWAGLEAKLPALVDLGITTLEIMPVAEFAGAFGWGYDGVAWFAPSHLYGTPDGFRRVVDRAHSLGLAVILDVVYNHFGVSGDYSGKYARWYTSSRKTEWGMGLNYDGPHAGAVRSLAIDNASYWIDEFHLDGLRLDATQAITDESSEHVVTALARAARTAARGRQILLVGENEPQDARLLRRHSEPGVAAGLDALWNDDFHHSSRVALTGRRQAYFSDYAGTAAEWTAAVRTGFLFQGQCSHWQGKQRGHATDGLPSTALVCFLENHDQVANSLWGRRLWQESCPAQYRAVTALLLLGPWTPLLFQGQEWASSAPFSFFANHEGSLGELVKTGRAEFLSQFPGCAAHPELLRDPGLPDTFEATRLRWSERALPEHAAALALHRDLLRLRRSDPALSGSHRGGVGIDATALSPSAGLVRYRSGLALPHPSDDRILLVNLGPDLDLERVTQPLFAPPERHTHWTTIWNSEDPAYGGYGTAEPNPKVGGWKLPGCAAVLLAPVPAVTPASPPDGQSANDR